MTAGGSAPIIYPDAPSKKVRFCPKLLRRAACGQYHASDYGHWILLTPWVPTTTLPTRLPITQPQRVAAIG
ncbi:hypothetical protein MGN01_45850 [Methylobacterium gnaphalii]|uniref:Uncharacterized protein n=1 Tax=Methylobacterium gnaphalii TaxID=1010610 RepID=A0A512JS10_9HYPH|nr:hypothetical protein MGN01_45850 [Methylobacterium gnaphalii]GLS50962.1 hypothetical protein GCM10007885_38160 [Methylobacterium gnaphalii]